MSKWHILWKLMMMTEIYEFEYNALEEMLIVNYQEGFSYNMCDEGDVYSVAVKLNELQSTISRLVKENEQLKAKLKRLQDIATRTEAEKEEYVDLYRKCENELINNGRRCDGA